MGPFLNILFYFNADYLEIRDGQYGYSPLIGKYCDSNLLYLPIESSSQNIWIKFSTDETIQQDGFRFSYEFKKSSKTSEAKNGNLGLYIKVFHIYSRRIILT